MAINRYPYKCEVCGIAMQKSHMRITGSRVYCSPCYGKEIKKAFDNMMGVSNGNL